MTVLNNPVIGISSTIKKHNNTPSVDVNEKYIQAITQAGGVPIVLPIGTEEMAEQWVSLCDGILLTGGEDVGPYLYHAHPSPQIQKTNEKRDKIESKLIIQAQNQKKPILAICRGLSILNVALGGTLIQDINTYTPNAINHNQQAARSDATHEVEIDESSYLYNILKRSKIRVNSMHHQAIDVLSPALKKVAITAPDGMIEAVEGIDENPLVLGIQWHPEELASKDPSMVALFQAFIGECNQPKKTN